MRAAPTSAVLALGACMGCAVPVPAGLGAAPVSGAPCATPASVQEIVWEQDDTGRPQGLRLRFGRDGQALLTATGKARLRTADVQQPAPLAAADFERLAAELAAAGLFGLAPRHEEPGLADGRWTQWRATCTDGTHEVFRREDAGPPALDALDAVVGRWRSRLWLGR